MTVGDEVDGASTGRVRVVIADDQPLVRMGLRALVRSDAGLELVGEAETGREAVALARSVTPDVVLMDIRMPELDGLAALREISADPALGGVHVVMLTTFELDEYVFAALQAGASGFMIKDSEPTELLRAIHAAASGEALMSPSVTRTVIETFAGRPAGAASEHPRLGELTEREREVLGLVGQGLNNAEIAERLWITKATARTHVSHIMLKLGARDRAQLVVIAYSSGLVR
ncbi:response regulator [Propioniciclava tarda]|nr:response regulator transcription factor [Propioniciclava tarda]SMO36004.1 two component transcriptional regulator, LuxR family [Propioniciclava tarda]HOA88373.1 response regulator transcription factor [Propioniciclava tarda]HQD61190.1 response regulator transcription factor [Propioniciclava tarda]